MRLDVFMSRLFIILFLWPLLSFAAGSDGLPMQDVLPAAGLRVKVVPQAYENTDIYYSLYLPDAWQADGKYPLIVEYTGNYHPPTGSTGEVKDACLGYVVAKELGAIWVVFPFIAADSTEALKWWGSESLTIDFALKNIRDICMTYGGNSGEVFLCGFSRGAIAVNYIGLHNDAIADVWRGFFSHDHYDGAKSWGKYWSAYKDLDEYRRQAQVRANRINGRAALVSNSGETHQLVEELSLDSCGMMTFIKPDIYEAIEGMNLPHSHTDRWLLSQKEDAQKVFSWFQDALANDYGVFTLSGMVKDKNGNGVEGVIVDAGGVHFGLSDKRGYYKIDGLISSTRTIRLVKEDSKDSYTIELKQNTEGLDFVVE